MWPFVTPVEKEGPEEAPGLRLGDRPGHCVSDIRGSPLDRLERTLQTLTSDRVRGVDPDHRQWEAVASLHDLLLDPSQDVLAVAVDAAVVPEAEVVVQADLLDPAALEEFDHLAWSDAAGPSLGRLADVVEPNLHSAKRKHAQRR